MQIRMRYYVVMFLVPICAGCKILTGSDGSSSTLASITDATDITKSSLAALDKNKVSWKDVDADMAHAYLGRSPREMALGIRRDYDKPQIPRRLKTLAETELPKIQASLGLKSVEFEMWPTSDGWGMASWQVARYRKDSKDTWKFLDDSHSNTKRGRSARDATALVLPYILEPHKRDDQIIIFNQTPTDITSRTDHGEGISLDSLYQHAAFESVVWTNPEMTKVYGAWEKYGREQAYIDLCTKRSTCKAIAMAPPARFDDTPVTFIARSSDSGIEFLTPLNWISENRSKPRASHLRTLDIKYPTDLAAKYKRYLKELSGETPIKTSNGQVIDFKKQSSGMKDNQLIQTAEYIEQLHRSLGYGSKGRFQIEFQRFEWLGIRQANLIARIRGRDDSQPIVIGSSHFDKAIAEDVFEASKWKKLETNPGANDAISGIGIMMLAAEIFAERYKTEPPKRTIELVYFTGEEFPAGTLGSRYYVSQLLKNKIDVKANVDLDMNGYRDPDDVVFQISAGSSEDSWLLAELAYSVARGHGDQWSPVVRHPWSRESFLGQTDGTVFEWMGYPTILINEHINLVKRDNPHYHQTTDVAKNVDVNYALAQGRVFVETLIRTAESQ